MPETTKPANKPGQTEQVDQTDSVNQTEPVDQSEPVDHAQPDGQPGQLNPTGQADEPGPPDPADPADQASQRTRTGIATLVDLILPPRCAGCGSAGPPLCILCAGAFDGPFDVNRPLTATGPPVHALAAYRDTARTILLAFKERGRRDLATPLGRMTAAVLPTLAAARPASDGTWWLVPAPSRSRAARRRGGSHILRLARATAAALADRGQPAAVAPALRLANSTRDSIGLDASARVTNLTGRVHAHPPGAAPPDTPVVLLDDVVTTGATAAACVRELANMGLTVTVVLALTAT
jgi:predicted amidophosphoribosyltransferase